MNRGTETIFTDEMITQAEQSVRSLLSTGLFEPFFFNDEVIQRIVIAALCVAGSRPVDDEIIENIIELMEESGDLIDFDYRGEVRIRKCDLGPNGSFVAASVYYNGQRCMDVVFESEEESETVYVNGEKSDLIMQMFGENIKELLRMRIKAVSAA